MSSVCISNCINDARDPRVPVRATYVNLYKWPESDAEFVKSMGRGANVRRAASPSAILHGRHPSVVDSISCRQMYLRSYPFSREADGGGGGDDREDLGRRCLSFGCGGGASDGGGAWEGDGGRERRRRRRKKKRGGGGGNGGGGGGGGGGEKKKKPCVMLRRAKEVSCDALLRLFHRLLTCSATVDVAV